MKDFSGSFLFSRLYPFHDSLSEHSTTFDLFASQILQVIYSCNRALSEIGSSTIPCQLFPPFSWSKGNFARVVCP